MDLKLTLVLLAFTISACSADFSDSVDELNLDAFLNSRQRVQFQKVLKALKKVDKAQAAQEAQQAGGDEDGTPPTPVTDPTDPPTPTPPPSSSQTPTSRIPSTSETPTSRIPSSSETPTSRVPSTSQAPSTPFGSSPAPGNSIEGQVDSALDAINQGLIERGFDPWTTANLKIFNLKITQEISGLSSVRRTSNARIEDTGVVFKQCRCEINLTQTDIVDISSWNGTLFKVIPLHGSVSMNISQINSTLIVQHIPATGKTFVKEVKLTGMAKVELDLDQLGPILQFLSGFLELLLDSVKNVIGTLLETILAFLLQNHFDNVPLKAITC